MRRKKLIILLGLIVIILTSIIIYKIFIEYNIVTGSGFETAYVIWKNKNKKL